MEKARLIRRIISYMLVLTAAPVMVVLFATVMLVFSFPAIRQQNWIIIGLAAILLLAYCAFRILIRRARD